MFGIVLGDPETSFSLTIKWIPLVNWIFNIKFQLFFSLISLADGNQLSPGDKQLEFKNTQDFTSNRYLGIWGKKANNQIIRRQL